MVERGGESSLARQYELLCIGRASLYREPAGESEAGLVVMRHIDEFSMDFPFYGSRQMSQHLRLEGVVASRHRVRRLMRVMGLEAVYRSPRTSEPHPGHRVYPYLLRGVAVERQDQVCCADITYIPVHGGFLYLVVVMDWATCFTERGTFLLCVDPIVAQTHMHWRAQRLCTSSIPHTGRPSSCSLPVRMSYTGAAGVPPCYHSTNWRFR